VGSGRDELQQGPDDQLKRVSRWLPVATVAVLMAAGAIALLPDGESRREGPAPSVPSASPSPSSATTSSRAVEPLDRAPRVALNGDVCTHTSHRRLSVAFGVANVSNRLVRLRRARPVLPLHGLHLLASTIGRASCGQTPGNHERRILPVGWSTVVKFTFALPVECPKPLPVEAELTDELLDGSRRERAQLNVLSDLGGLEFDQC
jgi:hypothetical protein